MSPCRMLANVYSEQAENANFMYSNVTAVTDVFLTSAWLCMRTNIVNVTQCLEKYLTDIRQTYNIDASWNRD